MKYLLIYIFFFQINFSFTQEISFKQVETKLKRYYDVIHLNKTLIDSQRLKFADTINMILGDFLNKNVFYYNFDSLKGYISSLYSPDSSIRILTWFVKFQERTYRYYGYVLKKIKGTEYKLYVLNDLQIEYNDSLKINSTFTRNEWLGCIYYAIYSYKYKNKTYYLLFGYDDYNRYINRKIVDVLHFKGNKIYFGAPIFKSDKVERNRLVFNYSEKAKFVCQYNRDLNAIIFDYLCPVKPEFQGMYEFYGPDGTYDGYFFSRGNWYLKKNLKIVDTKKPK